MMKTQRLKIAQFALGLTTIAVASAALCLAPSARAGSKAAPGHPSAFGRNSLAIWEDIWFRWSFGDITVPTDANGNAVVGSTVLLPTPSTPGDGTPGHLDVTLNNDQSFVLPLWVLLGTSYTDGTPPDPFVPDSVLQTLDICFTIDGATVVSGGNVGDYYSKFAFNPAIPINSPPYASVIWFQGIGITHAPLKPGTHTFALHAKNTQLAFGGFFEYNNTWTVTALP